MRSLPLTEIKRILQLLLRNSSRIDLYKLQEISTGDLKEIQGKTAWIVVERGIQ